MKKTFDLDVVLTAAYDKFLMTSLLRTDLESFLDLLDQLSRFLTEEADYNLISKAEIIRVLQEQCPKIFEYSSIESAYLALAAEMSSIELDNSYLVKIKLGQLRTEVESFKHDIKSI